MTTVVAGVGNPDRGDDAFGFRVIEALERAPPPGARLVRCRGDMAGLIETIASARLAIIVDAMVSGGTPGQIRRLDAQEPLSRDHGRFASTHGVDLSAAIELARALGQLPSRVLLYCVEASDFAIGSPMTPPVCAAVDEVVTAIRRDCG